MAPVSVIPIIPASEPGLVGGDGRCILTRPDYRVGWRDIYTNRSENNGVSVFTVTFARDRATQALEHDGVRANWQLCMPVALALLLDQRGFFTRRCNSDLTLVLAILQLPNDTMALLQRQPAR